MRIKRITANNVIGARNANIEVYRPILWLVGPNGAGKTTVCHAVRLAYLDVPQRVKLKKEYSALVTEGAERGRAAVEYDDGGEVFEAALSLPAGTWKSPVKRHPELPYLLDVGLFARSSANERRDVLFRVCGVHADPDDLAKILIERGHRVDHVKTIAAMLGVGGADAGYRQARTAATEARGAWKNVTGEAYGSVKAATWEAATVAQHRPVVLAQARADLATAERRRREVAQKLGELIAKTTHAREYAAKREELAAKALLLEGRENKLKVDEAILETHKTKVAELEAIVGEVAARAMPAATAFGCPHCGGLLSVVNGRAVAYEKPTHAPNPEAREALDKERQHAAKVLRWVENDRRAVTDARAAQDALKALGEGPTPPSGADVIALEQEDKRLLDSLAEIKAVIRAEEAAFSAADRATLETTRARALHDDIEAWEALAAALAPDGIRAEFLARALDMVNDRCAVSANDSSWPRVTIDRNMDIRFGGREYDVLARNEQFRADIMVTEMISFLSGLRMLMIDDVDILQVDHRNDLLTMLDALVARFELDTAIVMLMSDKKPSCDWDTVQTMWVENGVVTDLTQLEKAEVAA